MARRCRKPVPNLQVFSLQVFNLQVPNLQSPDPKVPDLPVPDLSNPIRWNAALQAIILSRECRSRATETPISRRAGSFGRLKSGGAVILATALMAVVAAALNTPARAACITQPNRLAPEGAHWSLHHDRDKNQRCWVLVDGSGRDISAPQPAASSGLSSLQAFIGNFTGASSQPQGTQANPAANPARKPAAPHVAHAGRVEQRPAVRSEPKGEPRPVRRELSQPERDKLFQEFLRWHENQKVTGTQNPPAPPR
jgi:hypothetical protein